MEGSFETISPEIFLGEKFDENLFVAQARKTASLDQLSSDLRQLLRSLRGQLVETINRDYSHFVSLPARLQGVDAIISSLQQPLQIACSEVSAIREELNDRLQELETDLAEREELIREERNLLDMIEIDALCQKIESLLNRDAAVDSEHSLLEEALLVERMAELIGDIQTHTARLSHLAAKNITEKCDNLASRLRERLDAVYIESLSAHSKKTDSEEVLKACFRAYGTTRWTSYQEEATTATLVRPYLAQHATISSLEGGIPGSTQGLNSLLSELLNFIEQRVVPLTVIAEKTQPPPPLRIRLISHCVWAAVAPHLSSLASGRIFQYTKPDQFHANYCAATAFVSRLEKLCASPTEASALRTMPVHLEFLRHWDLPLKTYYQLRSQQITMLFDAHVDGQQSSKLKRVADAAKADDFILAATKSCWQAMERCFASDVLIVSMGHRFVQLSLLLLSRYASWGAQQLEVQPEATTTITATATTIAEAPATSTAATTATSGSELELDPSSLLDLYADCEHLAAKVESELAAHIEKAFDSYPAAITLVQEAMLEGVVALRAVMPRLMSAVVEILIWQCCNRIAPMRSIPGAFRLTNKPAPTMPSEYVADILSPIFSLLKETRLRKDAQESLSQQVIESVSQRFCEMGTDLVATVRKTEESLRKLARTTGGTSSGTGGVSDAQKMMRQLQLDVSAFGEAMKKAGVTPESLTNFVQLQDVVSQSSQ